MQLQKLNLRSKDRHGHHARKTSVPQILVGHYQDRRSSDLSPFAQGGECQAVGSESGSICMEYGSRNQEGELALFPRQKDKELVKATCPHPHLQDDSPPGGPIWYTHGQGRLLVLQEMPTHAAPRAWFCVSPRVVNGL